MKKKLCQSYIPQNAFLWKRLLLLSWTNCSAAFKIRFVLKISRNGRLSFAALNAKLIHSASTQCKHLARVKLALYIYFVSRSIKSIGGLSLENLILFRNSSSLHMSNSIKFQNQQQINTNPI
ncbi:hypothetical protein DERF_013117 [Dermatophagoides farinae]|uniref:Uncharacterized protein n=1 Tax=Dermatophagoides farinae TaxID=6954 RepID=A0A922HQV4_DERFA|nr:hypothetical protein DERF_013117 [Dermatophagoides farinae]